MNHITYLWNELKNYCWEAEQGDISFYLGSKAINERRSNGGLFKYC